MWGYSGKIEGTLTAISIIGEKIKYEFSYFYNGDYRSVWISSYEFKVKFDQSDNMKKIGFK